MKYVETIRIIDGEVQQWEYHRKRAEQTSGILLPTIQVPQQHKHGIVKCRVVYDNTVTAIEFHPYTTPTIGSLKVVHAPHRFYDRKYTDRLPIEQLYAQRSECDDVLIVIEGVITDTSFCNIVFENEEGLFTPQYPLLCGTKRAALIDNGIIRPKHITLTDLSSYKRAYLINAMIDLDNRSTLIDVEQIIY